MQDAMDTLDEALDNAFHMCQALKDGCGECDPLFPCYQGAAHCFRLPLPEGARGSDTYVASAAGANGPGAPQ